jgi:hypothetical protein
MVRLGIAWAGELQAPPVEGRCGIPPSFPPSEAKSGNPALNTITSLIGAGFPPTRFALAGMTVARMTRVNARSASLWPVGMLQL